MYVTCFSKSPLYDPGCFENPEAVGRGEKGGDALKAPLPYDFKNYCIILNRIRYMNFPKSFNFFLNVDVMHFILYTNRLTATKVDSRLRYMGWLISNTQHIIVFCDRA